MLLHHTETNAASIRNGLLGQISEPVVNEDFATFSREPVQALQNERKFLFGLKRSARILSVICGIKVLMEFNQLFCRNADTTFSSFTAKMVYEDVSSDLEQRNPGLHLIEVICCILKFNEYIMHEIFRNRSLYSLRNKKSEKPGSVRLVQIIAW